MHVQSLPQSRQLLEHADAIRRDHESITTQSVGFEMLLAQSSKHCHAASFLNSISLISLYYSS